VGEVGGVTVVDDFAHHPTAIRETLRAARARFPGRRLWALVEPRSNTLRRNVFEAELVEALSIADRVVMAEVFNKEKLLEAERLKPENVLAALTRKGIAAEPGGTADQIVESLLPMFRAGDAVIVMSNGGFGGIHRKLLQGLSRSRASGTVAERAVP
jgi:UDP-N-acetylmuramate: L-alanyl-gamma-D-glutamyl-meso-diaminopimelate ligase